METDALQKEALALAKKFGFISRNVLWEFYCHPGKSMRYEHWKKLSESSFFSYQGFKKGVPEYLFLSAKGRVFMGVDSLTPTSSIYLEHDELVMGFFIRIKKEGFIENIWSEGELKADRALSIKCMGDGVVAKLPDLLFDIRCGNDFIRCALEIERTRKSAARYKTARRSYQRALNVDLLLFGVSDEGTERAIRKEFYEGGVNSLGKELAFFSIPEFQDGGLDCEMRLADKSTVLKKYFHSLAERVPSAPENNRKDSGKNLRFIEGD